MVFLLKTPFVVFGFFFLFFGYLVCMFLMMFLITRLWTVFVISVYLLFLGSCTYMKMRLVKC